MQDNVISVRLFGSHARGEDDQNSDIDILVVTLNSVDNTEKIIEELKISQRYDISIYSKKRIIEMFAEGHLFAWHLYLESKPMNKKNDESWFASLGSPSKYLEAEIDIKRFIAILREAILSFYAGRSIIFDAGICYLACRNLGLYMSFKINNHPNFSRTSALELPTDFRLPLSKADFDVLKMCRMVSKQGIEESTLNIKKIENSIDIVFNWLLKIEDFYEV